MGVNRSVEPLDECVHCGGPLLTPLGRGRPAIYCSGACRKAAFEARRAHKPEAYTVKIIDRDVHIEHDLTECVNRVINSPAACSRVLHALTNLSLDGPLRDDPKWDSTLTAARSLGVALAVPDKMRRYRNRTLPN